MIPVTDEFLDRMVQNAGSSPDDDYKWMSSKIERMDFSSGRVFYYPKLMEEPKPIMFQCLRCKQHYLHKKCDNCGGDEFKCGGKHHELGIYCTNCTIGFSSWDCTECGTINPASKTLYIVTKVNKKSDSTCFIATAAYGSMYAPELVILRQFRDRKLKQSCFGRLFVCTYEQISPPVANLISRHENARSFVRKIILLPIIKLLKMHQ